MKDSVDQHAETGGQNLNAGRDIVVSGVTAADVIQICEYLGKANFPTLMQAARETAEKRFEELARKYFKALAEKNPQSIQNFDDPGLQAALADAVTAYAKSGDSDVGDILADLLVERTQKTKRGVLQLSLDAALSTAAKLDGDHFSALSLVYLVTRVKAIGVRDRNALYGNKIRQVAPFAQSLSISDSDVLYMDSVGCSAPIAIGTDRFADILLQVYPGLYMTGITELDDQSMIKKLSSNGVLVPCDRDSSKLQVNAVDEQGLETILQHLTEKEEIEFVRRQFDSSPRLSREEVNAELIAFDPRFESIITKWESSRLGATSLTTTGIVIGYTNTRRVLGVDGFPADLSVWIY